MSPPFFRCDQLSPFLMIQQGWWNWPLGHDFGSCLSQVSLEAESVYLLGPSPTFLLAKLASWLERHLLLIVHLLSEDLYTWYSWWELHRITSSVFNATIWPYSLFIVIWFWPFSLGFPGYQLNVSDKRHLDSVECFSKSQFLGVNVDCA